MSGPLDGLLEDPGKRNLIEVGGGDDEGAAGGAPGDGEADPTDVVGNALYALGNYPAGGVHSDGAVGDASSDYAVVMPMVMAPQVMPRFMKPW